MNISWRNHNKPLVDVVCLGCGESYCDIRDEYEKYIVVHETFDGDNIITLLKNFTAKEDENPYALLVSFNLGCNYDQLLKP